MGFRYRKSIKLGGGFRINISSSGVGYSWGVPGYRITKTATGITRHTYSIPGAGISYTENVNPAPTQPRQAKPEYINHRDIETTARTDYTDSDVSAVINKIKRYRKINSVLSWVLGFSFFAIGTPVFAVALIAKLVYRFGFPVKLQYDFTDEESNAYSEWVACWKQLLSCKQVISIKGESDIVNSKVHAGAGTAVDTHKVKVVYQPPYFLKVNVPVVGMEIGNRQQLFILPDKVFYFDGKQVSVYDFTEIQFRMEPMSYIIGNPPSDTEIIRTTWEKVNKDGSPDKRYSGNKQVYVCRFAEFRFFTSTGLNVDLGFSDYGKAAAFRKNSIIENTV